MFVVTTVEYSKYCLEYAARATVFTPGDSGGNSSQ